LDVDSTLGEAHAVLGEIASDHDYNWSVAERHFQRAIELDPSYPTAHHWYSATLQYLGRFDDALPVAKRALELDPLSLIINTSLADLYYAMRQYEKSIEQSENTLALDPSFPWAHLTLASVYGVQGMHDKAIAETEKAVRFAGTSPVTLAYAGRAYATAGRRNDALRVLDELLQLEKEGNAVCTGIAFIYYKLGDIDKAFEWLEKAYQDHEGELVYLGVDPLWDDLRPDARCTELLKKMGLRR
jgi:tetratricopeptide (TPR) repeat protein